MASEQQTARLNIDLANADFTIHRNREIIDSLTEKLEAPRSAGVSRYYQDYVRQLADDIIQEAEDLDEDEGEDIDVMECLRRLFLDHQALPALRAILALEDDTNRGHFSFETCRRFAFWIEAELEPHECGSVFAANKVVQDFAKSVGYETFMMEHNPLFFKGGYKKHCTRVDFKARVGRFMNMIRSPVNFETVHIALGL